MLKVCFIQNTKKKKINKNSLFDVVIVRCMYTYSEQAQ